MAHRYGLPQTVVRCQNCFVNIFDATTEHRCPEPQIKSMRINVYAKSSCKLFELEVEGEIHILDREQNQMRLVRNGQRFFSAASKGLISIKQNGDMCTATFETCCIKTMSIFVAHTSSCHRNWHLAYHIEVSPSQCIRLHKIETSCLDFMNLPEHQLNTVAVVGVKSNSIAFALRIFANKAGLINYVSFNGWETTFLVGKGSEIEEWLIHSNVDSATNHIDASSLSMVYAVNEPIAGHLQFNLKLYVPEFREEDEFCYNCGAFDHMTQNCSFPDYILQCNRCLVISFDDSGHTAPCAPVNTVSLLRTNIYVKPLLPMFKMRMAKTQGTIHYLSNETGRFEDLIDAQVLMSAVTDGVFMFADHFANYRVLSYKGCRYRRFSIIIAVKENDMWRLRFRLVPTAIHGLIVFKMYSTLQLQDNRFLLTPENKNNTVLVIGIKPTMGQFKLDLRIYANENGQIERESDSVNASVKWVSGVGKRGYFIDERIDAEIEPIKTYFDKRLYDERLTPLEPFRSQRHDASE